MLLWNRHPYGHRTAVLAALSITAVLITLGCRGHEGEVATATVRKSEIQADFQTPMLPVDALLTEDQTREYLGDVACANCHRAIGDAFERTRHAQTLRPVRLSEHSAFFGHAAPIKDNVLGYTYRPSVKNGKCVITGESQSGPHSLSADYVMGAGRNAQTYFSVERPDAWVDLRISYFTQHRKWDYTPGQRPGDRVFSRAAGILQEGERLPACLSCHVTYLRAGLAGPDIAGSHLGIGCERCHGAGGPHARSIQRGKVIAQPAALQMEDFSRASPERINQLCGQCHHDESNSKPGDPKTENGLARFEGVALVRSRCYQASGALSCITCHDPHKDAQPNASVYVAQCLKCHSANGPSSNAAPRRSKICPINATSGCVGCHMPAQSIRTIPYAKYHNHWIKVWKR